MVKGSQNSEAGFDEARGKGTNLECKTGGRKEGRKEGRDLWRVVFPRGADDVGVIAGRART